ncbi:MAG TPA: tetratricopeptide repeat protein [Labilithrix sp.]|nr:tetratricopeptide repeat protein [Labilithrix sp.]
MKRQWLDRFAKGLGFAFALAATACGGGASKPPENPPSSASSAESPSPTDDVGATTKKIEGPAAASNGDEVKRGIAALNAGDINGAKAAFEVAIQKNPKQAEAYHNLGLVMDQMGKKAEAEKNYRKALELSPDLEEPATNLAAILVESARHDEAVSLMKKAIAKNPKNAALHVNLGTALSGKNDVAGANKAFEDAIKLEPNNGIHLVTYAGHLARNSKRDEALTKLKRAERTAANDAGVLASVALEYKSLKEFKTCVAVLDKAVQLKDIAELRIYRGTCKLGLRDLPGATTEFADAVAKEPNNPLAHYSLGNALADGGKLNEAIVEWETYLKLAPDGPQAKAAERKVAKAKAKASGGGDTSTPTNGVKKKK